MLLLLLLLIPVVLLIIYLGYTHVAAQKYFKNNGIPFQRPVPLLGNMTKSVLRKEHMVVSLQKLYTRYSNYRYFGFFNFRVPIIVIKDPELVKRITIKDFEFFPEHRSIVDEKVDPLWSKNLFSITGLEKWRKMRATLSPSFTSSKMRMMFHLMNDCAQRLTSYYLKEDGVVKIQARDTFRRYANDIIASTAFGVTCDSLKHKDNDFFLMGSEVSNFTGFRALIFFLYGLSPLIVKILRLTIFSQRVSDFFRRLIKENIKLREEKGIVRPDLIHLLLQARKGLKQDTVTESVVDTGFAVVQESDMIKKESTQMIEITDEDITAQALVFFLGGFDTSSLLMSFSVMELAANPEIQEKLAKEINKLYEARGDKPVYEDIMGLKYLDMILSETLRKWSPGSFFDRVAVKTYVIPPEREDDSSVVIEKGQCLWIPSYCFHMNPEYFPNPEKFDPERFNDENKHNIKPFTYMPFGLGPRNCIGSRFALLEAKILLYHILAHFEIIPIKETVLPLKLCQSQVMITPEGGFWCGLKKKLK